MFNNKTLMITGGTGSFGNTVLKRFLTTDVGEIRIFSRDEKKQEDMRIALANVKRPPLLVVGGTDQLTREASSELLLERLVALGEHHVVVALARRPRDWRRRAAH